MGSWTQVVRVTIHGQDEEGASVIDHFSSLI